MTIAENFWRLFRKPGNGVFVSFRTSDVDTARPIAEALLSNGLKVWFSEYAIDFQGRARFADLIDEGIRQSRLGICFLSKAYFRSSHCRHELRALTHRIAHDRILCLELEETAEFAPNKVRIATEDEAIAAICERLGVTIRRPLDVSEVKKRRISAEFEGTRFSFGARSWEVGSGSGPTHWELAAPNLGFKGLLHVRQRRVDADALKDGTYGDHSLVEDLVRTVRKFGIARGEARCIGFHTLWQDFTRQCSFTVQRSAGTSRVYSLVQARPAQDSDIEILVAFDCACDREQFLSHAVFLDRFVQSVRFDEQPHGLPDWDPMLPVADQTEETAEEQARVQWRGANPDALATDFFNEHLGNHVVAPGAGGVRTIGLRLKLDILMKHYPPELSALIVSKLPISLSREMARMLSRVGLEWAPGANRHAADTFFCLLSLMGARADGPLRSLPKESLALLERARQRLFMPDGKRRARAATASSAPLKLEFMRIPQGTFRMGTSPQQLALAVQSGAFKAAAFERETPQREVWLDGFEITRFPITCAQYKQFTDATRYPVPFRDMPLAKRYNWDRKTRDYPPGLGNHPVVLVDWHDAAAFAQWAGLRLPTEAQWEKAARGLDGRIWPWGNEWDESLCNNNLTIERGASTVDKYPGGISTFGVMDMAGNVWEWCRDGFAENYHHITSERNPLGQGDRKVIRGGSFFDESPELYRCAVRDGIAPEAWESYRGFRCVRSSEP